MASTNKTPHYDLSQFLATDKPSWTGDINADMLKIDTGIFNAQTTGAGAASDAAGALTAAQNAQTAAEAAQTAATSAQEAAASAQTAATTANGTATEAKTTANAASAAASQAQTAADAAQTTANAASAAAGQAQATATNADTNANSALTKVNDLPAMVAITPTITDTVISSSFFKTVWKPGTGDLYATMLITPTTDTWKPNGRTQIGTFTPPANFPINKTFVIAGIGQMLRIPSAGGNVERVTIGFQYSYVATSASTGVIYISPSDPSVIGDSIQGYENIIVNGCFYREV